MTITNKIRGFREIWKFDNRWFLIFSRLFFPRQNVQFYRFKGTEFLSDHWAGDSNGAREVLTSPMYRQYLSLMQLPKEISVLDLGSNNGGFPLLLKAEGFKIKSLACVELNPRTFVRLKFNLERNFSGRFIALNCGVCSKPRVLAVNLGEGSAGDSIYRSKGPEASVSLEILGMTFDDVYKEAFGEEDIDLCKIDVEGAEFEIFDAAAAKSISKCRYLLMEIHHKYSMPRERVLTKLHAAGFDEIGGETKNGSGHYVHFFVNRSAV